MGTNPNISAHDGVSRRLELVAIDKKQATELVVANHYLHRECPIAPLGSVVGNQKGRRNMSTAGTQTTEVTHVALVENAAIHVLAQPANQQTRDMCRELEPGVTPGELRAEYDDLNNQITAKLDVYVASASKAKTDFDAILPELDRMQEMLSQRGRLRSLMDTIGLPTWTKWYEDFRKRTGEEFTIRTIQRKLREYRGIPDTSAESDTATSEAVEPGSREDTTRPIWIDQDIKVTYNAELRRMEAEAERVERLKEQGNEGNPETDRMVGRITVWQAVYAEPDGKVDKAALTQAVLAKVIAAAEDTDYFDVAALNKKANELGRKAQA